MRELLPELLWIGNAIEARNIPGVLRHGVHAVIDLAMEERPIQFPRDIVYCRFPLIDGSGNVPVILCAAVEVTARFIAAKVPTLVFCSAGMSRSPAIVAAAVAIVDREPLVSAVRWVTAGSPHDVSPGLLKDVAEACKNVHLD